MEKNKRRQLIHHYGTKLTGGGGDGTDQSSMAPGVAELQKQARMHPFDDIPGCSGYAQGRWPRQETLTLLEVRSRLDHMFKEAAHKTHLWDEVSRIMEEEYGYKRSGKKCREKLENLYKYYKKTKEAKTARQDGKNYRFFRQLEALYGGATTSSSGINPDTNDISAFVNSSYRPMFHTSINEMFASSLSPLSEEEEGWEDKEGGSDREKGLCGRVLMKRARKCWRSRMKELVDAEVGRFVEMQEAWLEKMLKSLERKEEERMAREEEWRRREVARLERENRRWARERARTGARDTALIEALQTMSRGGGIQAAEFSTAGRMVKERIGSNGANVANDREGIRRRWPEEEITNLIQLRTMLEARFRDGGCPKMALWEEISAGMAALGHERSAKRCKEKWENINKYFRKCKECNTKRKENSKTCPYYKHLDALYSQGRLHLLDDDHDNTNNNNNNNNNKSDPSPVSSNMATLETDSCFYLLMDGSESF